MDTSIVSSNMTMPFSRYLAQPEYPARQCYTATQKLKACSIQSLGAEWAFHQLSPGTRPICSVLGASA